MNASSDPQLLRDYAERRSEAAFAELVRRHIDLVHSAAFRMVNDSHLAKDVSQGVFVALAKDAGKLAGHPVLSGWLHRTARNLAAKVVRTDVRRRVREKEAVAMNDSSETDTSWEEIAPHLDAALADLSEPDRDAVLLRYFEKKPANEMSEILGISAEAAQKRVTRAVEKLRENFAKRGITAGVAGIVGTISTHAVQAAPVGLAMQISSTASLTTTQGLSTVVLRKCLLTAAVGISIGLAIYQSDRAAKLQRENLTLRESFNARPISVARARMASGSSQDATIDAMVSDAGDGFQVMATIGGVTDPGEFSLIAPGGRGITTGAAEAADLTPDERKAVDDILRAAWKKIAADFAARAVPVHGESDPEAGISVFTIPARPDRGKGYVAELETALDAAVGVSKRSILMSRLNPDHALGGFGSFNVRMEFKTKGGFVFKCLYLDPDSGETELDLSGGLDTFVEYFDDSFEFPEMPEDGPRLYR